uniref:Uncharacterized protein n=1 Tax=Meloidogyne enterolobii TaxID=390850 RepID=A0A6V7VSJ2_MELEN|nr:unnamed protein product [Meloidogyne enterolobii]
MTGKIFVVTGANKGIGYGIVRGLAQQLNGATIYLTGGLNRAGTQLCRDSIVGTQSCGLS